MFRQGRPRIPSFSNRGGASHSDYSAQRVHYIEKPVMLEVAEMYLTLCMT